MLYTGIDLHKETTDHIHFAPRDLRTKLKLEFQSVLRYADKTSDGRDMRRMTSFFWKSRWPSSQKCWPLQ